MKDLAGRLANRIRLTTDGHHMYLPAMAASLTDHVWTVKDIIALMDPVTALVE